jgi:hypothetical protein
MDTENQKLRFDHLSIEITRRCNMTCSHCLRGDAQGIDISLSIIDTLLKQASSINTLFFTGGEPLLCPEIMNDILSRLIAHDVPLHSLEVISNGTIKKSEVVDVFKSYYSYIRQCTPDQINESITICISSDRYHVGNDPWEAIAYYRHYLKDIANVDVNVLGNIPWKIGRAKTLPRAAPPVAFERIARQIHILYPGERGGCREWRLFTGLPTDVRLVCCPLHIAATGDVTQLSQYIWDNDDEGVRKDFVVCNLIEKNCSIDEAIAAYNQNKPSCGQATELAVKMQIEESKADPIGAGKTAANLWEMQLKGNSKDVKKFMDSLTPAEHAEVRLIEELLAWRRYSEELTAFLS